MRGRNSEADPRARNWATADSSVCQPPNFFLSFVIRLDGFIRGTGEALSWAIMALERLGAD
jgi:hypothetical protein